MAFKSAKPTTENSPALQCWEQRVLKVPAHETDGWGGQGAIRYGQEAGRGSQYHHAVAGPIRFAQVFIISYCQSATSRLSDPYRW